MTRDAARLLMLFVLASAWGPGAASRAAAQDAAARLFDRGLADFRAGEYAAAASAFGLVPAVPGRNPYVTAALVMAAKSEYRAGRYAEAKERAASLLEREPGSKHADHALYLGALSDHRMGRHELAADALITLAARHPGSPVRGEARELFDLIAASHLPPSELRRLLATDLPAGLRAPVALALARLHLRRGEDSTAFALLDALAAHPDGARAAEAIASLRAESGSGGPVQVGVLLPLMGGRRETDVGLIAGEILDGIREAAGGADTLLPAVELLVRDSGRDPATAAGRARELGESSAVRCIVGPVFSEEFAAAAGGAASLGVPILSPTATADGLAGIGPRVFQANPDHRTRGRAAALYAVRDLRMSSFAVLASDDPVGRAHAAAFLAEAAALGATIHRVEFFPPDASDLREHFLAIRRSVMAGGTMVRTALLREPGRADVVRAYGLDSLLADGDTAAGTLAGVTELFGPRGYAVAESLGLPFAAFDTTADDTDVPLVTLDGLYVALGDPGQLDFVAPQLGYFNIRAQVIGNNEWYDPDRLRANRGSVEGALFLSDSHLDFADPDVASFAAAFERRNGRRPSKFTFYGYDAMRLVLEGIRNGGRTRGGIAEALAASDRFPGLHGEITLAGTRVNRSLGVLQYAGGKVARIGAVTVGEP